MKQVILYTLIILTFHLIILLVPLVLFIMSLNLPGISILHIYYWLYLPLIIISPILILTLGYRVAAKQTARPWIAIFPAFFGFSPIWITYLSLTSPWNLGDLAIVLFSPIFLGLIAVFMVKITNKNST